MIKTCSLLLIMFLVCMALLADSFFSKDLLKLAKKGDAIAQFDLAEAYRHGRGVKQDYKSAVKWYTKASESGHKEAGYTLGELYLKGEGVKPDPGKSDSPDVLHDPDRVALWNGYDGRRDQRSSGAGSG